MKVLLPTPGGAADGDAEGAGVRWGWGGLGGEEGEEVSGLLLVGGVGGLEECDGA